MSTEPTVSIVMPARNEEKHIGDCIESILEGSYPIDDLEIIIVDGCSEDSTLGIVERLARKAPVRVLKNPNRTTPYALNIGIEAARGQYIVRMDAHCRYHPDYVRECVKLLETTDAQNVGGSQHPIGESLFERSLAAVLSSRFAAGGSYWKRPDIQPVKTVFLGAWKTSTLRELGGFATDWTINQDAELNARLARAGGTILYSPQIKCEYVVRSSMQGLMRQHFRYGMYRVKTFLAYPETVAARHLAPPAFVLALLAALICIVWTMWPIVALASAYGVLAIASALQAARRSSWRLTAVIAGLFPAIHVAWGVGFLAGTVRWPIRKIRRPAAP